MRPYVRDVPILLEGGIRVLIYAGDADFICNWMGNKAWAKQLPWTGQKEFSKAKDQIWINPENGKKAGEVRSYKNFAFLRVFKAGHMVSYFKRLFLTRLGSLRPALSCKQHVKSLASKPPIQLIYLAPSRP
ncbi:hypothetical protein DSO57_1017234 [Entomophthora muscae]|uniref:Uncharacterized protein n=1 Tax=Entomophthora muscae TaxID=34485 RepID=A0ACC2STM1_9FUNG|nr:hypothetical protein DSO57_1017234 [Entomophthora muscae]